jgi:hypothetical protein
MLKRAAALAGILLGTFSVLDLVGQLVQLTWGMGWDVLWGQDHPWLSFIGMCNGVLAGAAGALLAIGGWWMVRATRQRQRDGRMLFAAMAMMLAVLDVVNVILFILDRMLTPGFFRSSTPIQRLAYFIQWPAQMATPIILPLLLWWIVTRTPARRESP